MINTYVVTLYGQELVEVQASNYFTDTGVLHFSIENPGEGQEYVASFSHGTWGSVMKRGESDG